MKPTPCESSAHVCETCNAVTLRWVRWQNARGAQRYFCDNECLGWWVQCERANVIREVNLELQDMARHA